MGKPYSDDLRERVVAAIEAGHTREEVAELYNNWIRQREDDLVIDIG
jgi:transposase